MEKRSPGLGERVVAGEELRLDANPAAALRPDGCAKEVFGVDRDGLR